MINFIKILSLTLLTVLFSCNSVNEVSDNINLENDTINYIQKDIDINGEEFEQIEDVKTKNTPEKSTYKGSWFEIEYPSNFIATPTKPLDKFDDYEFVVTDEAYFSAPNNDVEFFVYSPQWGGEPLSYIKLMDNEEIISEKTTIDEINSNIILKWVTIKDKKGKYTRSYYSKHTESTHLVFGTKYNTPETYDLYKEDYKAFKESLVQYAD